MDCLRGQIRHSSPRDSSEGRAPSWHKVLLSWMPERACLLRPCGRAAMTASGLVPNQDNPHRPCSPSGLPRGKRTPAWSGFSQRWACVPIDSRCALVFIPVLSRRSTLGLAHHPRKRTRFWPNGSPCANDPMLPLRSSASRSAARRRSSSSGNVKPLLNPKQAQSCVSRRSSPLKNTIEIKLPSGIPIFDPISAVKSIAAILEQVEKLKDCPRVFPIHPRVDWRLTICRLNCSVYVWMRRFVPLVESHRH